MKAKHIFSVSALVCICFLAAGQESTYVGSTPAHRSVREFLGISLTDSIDFIRWKLVTRSSQYEVLCKYGISKPSTPGFIDEKRTTFSGALKKEKNYYNLVHESKTLSMLIMNSNLLHLADENKKLLVGNGGYSYALNIDGPVKTDQFNTPVVQGTAKSPLVYEGRTPCQELSNLLVLNRREECNKLKWYFILYTDSLTGKPSHYLSNGTAYRKETMAKGKWEIVTGKNGKVTYKLSPEAKTYSIYLLKIDTNILIFTDPEGNLLVGNENFSYTLNRRKREYPPSR